MTTSESTVHRNAEWNETNSNTRTEVPSSPSREHEGDCGPGESCVLVELPLVLTSYEGFVHLLVQDGFTGLHEEVGSLNVIALLFLLKPFPDKRKFVEEAFISSLDYSLLLRGGFAVGLLFLFSDVLSPFVNDWSCHFKLIRNWVVRF